MEKITQFTSKAIILPIDDVDTDQIVPARFLTTTEREGIGVALFIDWRLDKDGNEIADFPLNHPDAKNRKILVAGRNFGCGSSREHAPHALMDFGFRVVISSEIADIFRNNCQNVGLLPIVLPQHEHAQLLAMDGQKITVDLNMNTITLPGQYGQDIFFNFTIDGFARHCLLQGMDRLDFLLAQDPAIRMHEEQL